MDYINELQKYYTDINSSEMSYRTPFQNLLETIFKKEEKYKIQHDQRTIDGNKPDFVILKNNIPVLYIEVKKPGEDLDKIEKSSQADRYFGYDNLIISDYINFRLYRYGKKYEEPISLAYIDPKSKIITYEAIYGEKINPEEKLKILEKTFLDFVNSHKEEIKSGKHLAEIMGGKALRIRENVLEMLKNESSGSKEIANIKEVMKASLVHDLDEAKFADMYAQTLVYGLFAARYNDKTADSFSRLEAIDLIPKTNPFLREFFGHIVGTSFPERLRFIVDELCEVFSHANVHKLLTNFYGKEKDNRDPVIHFYEDFLKEYDAKKKMEMGVFYTPQPVVDFIVRGVDEILRREFNIVEGLADTQKIKIKIKEAYQPQKLTKAEKEKIGKVIEVEKEVHRVQILDIATGTGTFLNQTINKIRENFEGQEGRWKNYVDENLLPRLHGFELMMAPYTIAHLKLGMNLVETGVDVNSLKNRIGIYLTNTLEDVNNFNDQFSLLDLIMSSIAEESRAANRIKKETPIMCVIGNPPYSGISQNKDFTLNNDYKVEIGGQEKLKEKKNWLDDDYVKFIRFAESLIEKNGEGVIGMITAHGYIDNPTFRGMRWHLRNTFDKVYVLDLHGNSRKKEVSPDGSKDQNVFDIQTGVSIIFGVKNQKDIKNKKLADIYKADLYGTRESKFEKLENSELNNIQWKKLATETDLWVKQGGGKEEYMKGFSVAEIFPVNTTGIVTMGDSFIIDQDRNKLKERVNNFLQSDISESELKNKYGLGKNYAKWIIDNKNKIENNQEKIVEISYRPFDKRYTYFDNNLVWRPRDKVMKSLVLQSFEDAKKNKFIGKKNYGLVFKLGNQEESSVSVMITDSIIDFRSWSRPGMQGGDYVAPIYIIQVEVDRFNSNRRMGFIKTNLDEKFSSYMYRNEIYSKKDFLNPENILDYIYAVLHSPEYREKYKEFLKIDFPRVPYPTDKKKFFDLVKIGEKLRKLHLMEDESLKDRITTYPKDGANLVEKIKYEDGNVYINKEQYFGGVPEVAWNFYIGGYQPAQKYLKDRKGRNLSDDEMKHYQTIIKVLVETDKVMKRIKI